MSEMVQSEVADGRRARSERSKQAIIDASLALIEQGNLIPTAQQISDQAGVGIRSFFRHFEDMETLFATIDNHVSSGARELYLGGDRDGTLEKRIWHAVNRRSEGYEEMTNLFLTTTAQLWRSEILRKNYARVQRELRKDLEDWLPEIKQLARGAREAVDAIASIEMWHRIRSHQGLGRAAAVEVVAGLLNSLVKD